MASGSRPALSPGACVAAAVVSLPAGGAGCVTTLPLVPVVVVGGGDDVLFVVGVCRLQEATNSASAAVIRGKPIRGLWEVIHPPSNPVSSAESHADCSTGSRRATVVPHLRAR